MPARSDREFLPRLPRAAAGPNANAWRLGRDVPDLVAAIVGRNDQFVLEVIPGQPRFHPQTECSVHAPEPTRAEQPQVAAVSSPGEQAGNEHGGALLTHTTTRRANIQEIKNTDQKSSNCLSAW